MNISKRKGIILFAVIASVLLYLAGIFSGLYATKIFKEETQKDFWSLRYETKQDLEALQEYIAFLDTNLKNMQLEESFMKTLSHEEMCNYSKISFNELIGQLRVYWEKLPYRIEEYEKNNYLSEEYLLLKQQYTHLSIRTWLLAKSQYEKCGLDVIHGLYFYSRDCPSCVTQGEELDILHWMAKSGGKEIIMFPIDLHSNESIIKNLKEYYKINSTPAVMINNKVFKGRVFKAEELINSTKRKENEENKTS